MSPLKTHHTFALPTHCEALLSINDPLDIVTFAQLNRSDQYWILGEGSNTVFVEDFEGTVLQVRNSGINFEQTADDYKLSVAAGENWHQLVVWCLQQGIRGFENLALIPGTVGAAPIQNIGAYGVELERFVESVEYLDLLSGESVRILRQDCKFGYRNSIFKQQLSNQYVITQVNFSVPKDWQPVTHYGELAELVNPSAEAIFDSVVSIRQRKLPNPNVMGNAGSFFKNPVVDLSQFELLQRQYPNIPNYPLDELMIKIPAAWLIDTLGFKGKSVGGICSHPQQALVLTNNGKGTGQQLLDLARQIKQSVSTEFAIELVNEVQLVGRRGLISL